MGRNCALVEASLESKVAACVRLPVTRFGGEALSVLDDSVIQEMELRVVVNGRLYRDMTCSPWDVKELVVGSLFLEGALESPNQVLQFDIDLETGVASALLDHRRSGLEELQGGGVLLTGLFSLAEDDSLKQVVSQCGVSAQSVVEGVSLLEDRSLLFRRTGGVHSAVLVDKGGVVAWFEDIGRHSALDKLAGWCFLNDVDTSNKMLLFSGRVPREIIVKAIRLGCPIVVSPGAPTNLSISLAQTWGVTLVGFAKHGAFNIYSHPERIGEGVSALRRM